MPTYPLFSSNYDVRLMLTFSKNAQRLSHMPGNILLLLQKEYQRVQHEWAVCILAVGYAANL